jgi:hypothetical protein
MPPIGRPEERTVGRSFRLASRDFAQRATSFIATLAWPLPSTCAKHMPEFREESNACVKAPRPLIGR